jgi:hypothetical protein
MTDPVDVVSPAADGVAERAGFDALSVLNCTIYFFYIKV